jgi:hypothetical protein
MTCWFWVMGRSDFCPQWWCCRLNPDRQIKSRLLQVDILFRTSLLPFPCFTADNASPQAQTHRPRRDEANLTKAQASGHGVSPLRHARAGPEA